jgi:MFS family permease
MNIEIIFALLSGLNYGVIIMNIPPVLSELMDLYGVSYTRISILMGALLWVHAAMQIPAGLIVDRLGVRRTQFLSFACMAAGCALPAFAPSLAWGIGGRMLTGVGTGLGWLTTLKMLALAAPAGRAGAYQAFFAGLFSLGGILAFLLIPPIARAGWQWVYWTPAILCLLQLAMVPALRPATVRTGRPLLPLRQILGIREAWLIGIYHAISYGVMMSLGNWIPSLLAEASPGRSATQLAWGGALFMLVSGLGRISGGFVIFRVSPYLIAHGSVLVLALLMGGLALIPHAGTVLVLALLGAWFGSFVFGAIFQLASRSGPPESLGAVLGFINFLANFGAVFFTLTFGWFKDAFGSFVWGYALIAPLAILALIAGLRVLGTGKAAAD